MDSHVEAATLLLSVVGELKEEDPRRLGLLTLAAGHLAKNLVTRNGSPPKVVQTRSVRIEPELPSKPVNANAHPRHRWTKEDVGLCRRLYLRKKRGWGMAKLQERFESGQETIRKVLLGDGGFNVFPYESAEQEAGVKAKFSRGVARTSGMRAKLAAKRNGGK